jgi:hypothetical protein
VATPLQAFATLTSLFVGDTWSVRSAARASVSSLARSDFTALHPAGQTTGWAWSECSARPPKELTEAGERAGKGSAEEMSKTDDDTPTSSAVLTVISLADGGDASWPDVHDQSSSFLEAALRVLCCRAPGPSDLASAIFIGADDAGEQCTFHRTFDAGGARAALQDLDELSAECARSAIRARITMSQPERLAADRLLEEHRAALLGSAAGGDASAAPSSHLAELLADLPLFGVADDGTDVQQSLAKLERRCITGICTTIHRALRLLLTAAPKQDVAPAELRSMLQSALADVNALHVACVDRVSRLEGALAAGEESPGRLRARAAREEMESARSQAQAVLMRAAALTVFVLVVAQLKPMATAQH